MIRPLALALPALAIALGLAAAPAAAEPRRVAIANFGPHPTLEEAVQGLKDALADAGFAEGEGVVYEYSHGNFDPSLTPQILNRLEAWGPDVLVTVTTPMTQASREIIQDKDLPIVFAVVTLPVEAGLVPSWERGSERYVGSSNLQSMDAVIGFARDLLGEVTSFGMLYNTGDINDVNLVRYAEEAAGRHGLAFRSEGVESAADIQTRATALAGVDFIYVPASSLLQPGLPAVAVAADRMNIPVINASHPGVRDHTVLASMAISWDRVGYNAGRLVAEILGGKRPSELANHRPAIEEHSALVSGRRLAQRGMTLPAALAGCDCVVD
ncbi:MAG: ABC transporter substrate-binding protein [Rhodobacteraceae bacterium]|jgi:putative ABC transport system substrate-binding protein|nr:ABC transporter substrate-binding protein [Paracoccaceae bacterium]